MLAKQPEQRVQQMSEVVAELEAIAGRSCQPDARPKASDDRWNCPPAWAAVAGSTIAIDRAAAEQTVAIGDQRRADDGARRGAIARAGVDHQELSCRNNRLAVVGTVANGSDAIEAVRNAASPSGDFGHALVGYQRRASWRSRFGRRSRSMHPALCWSPAKRTTANPRR